MAKSLALQNIATSVPQAQNMSVSMQILALRQLLHFSLCYITNFITQLNSYSFFDSLKAIFSLLLNSISLTFVLYSLLLILRHLVLRDKPVADVIIQQCISHLLLPPTCLFHTSVSTGKEEIGKPFIFLIIISS